MKINGKTYTAPNEEFIVIPRPEDHGGDMIFKARAIIDMDEFETLCPRPKPPMGMGPGGAPQPIVDNQSYQLSLKDYGERRFAYIIIKSLEATEGLEWDTVVFADPASWKNYEKDLKKAGLNHKEIEVIIRGCLEANALSEDKLTEARNRFLAFRALQDALSSSPQDGQ